MRSSPGYFAKKDLRKCRRSGTAILAEEAEGVGAGEGAPEPSAGLGGAADEASNSRRLRQEESAETRAASSVSESDRVDLTKRRTSSASEQSETAKAREPSDAKPLRKGQSEQPGKQRVDQAGPPGPPDRPTEVGRTCRAGARQWGA